MKPFDEILSTKPSTFEPLYWQRKPLTQYFDAINSLLANKLGKEYAKVLARPKPYSTRAGQGISWRAAHLGQDARPMSALTDIEIQIVESKTQGIKDLTQELKDSGSSDNQAWGELLSLCFAEVGSDCVFYDGKNIVVAGWGMHRIEPFEHLPFGTGYNPKTPDSRKRIIPPTSQEEPNNFSEEKAEVENPTAQQPESPIFIEPIEVDIPEDRSADLSQNTGNPIDDDGQGIINGEDESHSDENYRHDDSGSSLEEEDNKSDSIPPTPPSNSDLENGHKKNWWMWWLLLLLLLLALFFAWKSCNPNLPIGGSNPILPENPGEIVPVDPGEIGSDPDSVRTIVLDRLNVALKGENKDIDAFAKAFKQAYPDDKFKIIYYDTATYRIQIRLPDKERDKVKEELPIKLKQFNMLIWHESVFSRDAVPSDPAYGDRQKAWYVDMIRVAGAWDITFGSKSVVVAVADDGFDVSHPELSGNVTSPWNVVNHSTDVFTYKAGDHGSHVAGTAIGGRDNGQGLSGIAPDCSFMPIQVADGNGYMTTTGIVDAVLYAISHDADVLNLSLGMQVNPMLSAFPPHVQQDMIHNTFLQEEAFWNDIYAMAEEAGLTIVIAGGNDNVLVGLDPKDRSSIPIKVAALETDYSKASFSNYGNYSTVSAPGVQIFSSVPNGQFAFMQGTSMAAPIVTGAVALLKSMNPQLTPREIQNILVNTGKPLSANVGPLIQLDRALGGIDNPDINPAVDCDEIQSKIDSLNAIIDMLKKSCPSLGSQDTMKMPDVIDDLDFSLGRWKSTTPLHNDFGEEVVLYFDFYQNQSGELTLVEPSGEECKAPLRLSANQTSFDIDQLKRAQCANSNASYSEYSISCQADANGYAECVAQNKNVKANRIPFRLVKIQ